MTIYTLDKVEPRLTDEDSAWVAPDANVIGDVSLGKGVGIWFGATLRGDNERITVGDGSNIQENTVMHTDFGFPLNVGENCTIGHRAILHGCTIGDGSLVGMGAIVLNGAEIGAESLVGAGALVTEGKTFPPRSLIMGVPAKVVRTLTDAEADKIKAGSRNYVANARRFRDGMKPA